MTNAEDLRTAGAESLQNWPSGPYLILGGLTLNRQKCPAGLKKSRSPASQPVQGRHRPRRHKICPNGTAGILRPSPSHGSVGKAESAHALTQEVDAPKHRLQQDDVKPGAHQRQHDAGQAGPGADVNEKSRLRQQLSHHGAVQQMPVPEPFGFPGSDEAADNALGCQQLGELPRTTERRAEHLSRGRRRRRRAIRRQGRVAPRGRRLTPSGRPFPRG